MQVEQKKWAKKNGWQFVGEQRVTNPQLVLAFGGTDVVKDKTHLKTLQKEYPKSTILMGSTAGEIIGTEVSDDCLVVSAIHFEKTTLSFAHESNVSSELSSSIGERLAKKLSTKGLVHVMVFSDGLNINGTGLVQGMFTQLPKNVAVTGGLLGDGARFKETVLGLNEVPKTKEIVAIGFYGKNLKVGYGSLGGWDTFGPERQVTKSKNNVLYELDGQPALPLYKKYLGDKAQGLPGTGLLFPLSLKITIDGKVEDIVRTILSVDEKDQTMTFAGDIPQGVTAQLMKANFDKLIDGAQQAASMSKESLGKSESELAILVSCIGRKLVLKDRIEEEIEAVDSVLGSTTPLIGFYSYGEICPTASTSKQCQLHNQTMTITTLREVV